ncbi:G-protein coupled receptor GRL101-like, partial [Limulus polyphemus]|uniref:G-protein coupled receptor GRL101-like n=1 Tax=Limulus polyphemus TaxID=6850 RepID=A0ABM1TQK1_LIMPO
YVYVLFSIFRGNSLSGALQKGAFVGMEKAGMLDLGRNKITHLTPGLFQNLWRLKILYLDENLLTSLSLNTFLGLGQLRSLNLKQNFIQEIYPSAFSGLFSLKTLDLSHQNLLNISRNAFLGLRSLFHLDLSHNYLMKLNDGVFNGLDQLLSLDLTYNKVTHMESRIFVGLMMLKKLRSDEFRFCCLAPHVAECYPAPDEFSSCKDLMSNIVLRVCIWFLGVLALTGNMVVIVWRSVHRINNKVFMNYYNLGDRRYVNGSLLTGNSCRGRLLPRGLLYLRQLLEA